jgi:hypothetical protein
VESFRRSIAKFSPLMAAPKPHPAKRVESPLVGRRIDESAAKAAGRAAIDGAWPFAGGAGKPPRFETAVRRAVLVHGSAR